MRIAINVDFLNWELKYEKTCEIFFRFSFLSGIIRGKKSGDVDMSKLLQAKSLSFSYASSKVIEDVSFTLEEGEMISVIGPSSSGKTTLLKLCAGILDNHHAISFGYGYLSKKNQRDLEKIGCVFADDFTFLFDTVYEEVTFPLVNLNLEKEVVTSSVKEIFSLFDVSYLLDEKVMNLTKEEKALLRLILALITHPVLLVLDNPFVCFSKSMKKKIIPVLKDYCKKNQIAMILSSTNLEDILFCDKTYVLASGKIVLSGETLTVLKEDVFLKKLGLSLPFIVDLSKMLEFYEILDEVYIDLEGLVNHLWK